jgi:hypothetical protein
MAMHTVTKLLAAATLAALFQMGLPHTAQAQFPTQSGAQPYPNQGLQFAPTTGQYPNQGNPYQGRGNRGGRNGNNPYNNNGYNNNGGGQNGNGQGQAGQLPDGVDALIAHEGTNEIIALATQEGYEHVRELVKIIDGQLDIIRTEVKQVPVGADDLKTLGLPTDTSGAPLSDADATKLLGAVKTGVLRSSATVRITTRESTPVDTLLTDRTGVGTNTAGTQTPLSLVPREQSDGSLALEIIQPTHTFRSVATGGSVVLPLPGQTAGAVTFLVLTPSILPSETRPVR